MLAKGSKNQLRRVDWDNARAPVTVSKCNEDSRARIARSVKNLKSEGEQGTGKHTRDEGKTAG